MTTMQMVYKARNLADAQGIREVLASSGIPAYLGDPASEVGSMAGSVRVSVDNERLDAARRAIAAWHHSRKFQPH
jgi:hypothetical protein